MASKKTEHYGLSQWNKTDPVRVEDFNEDNRKIDAAIAAIPKMVFGSYQGTGSYGENYPNTLTFDFDPDFVILLSGDSYPVLFLFQGKTTAAFFTSTTTRHLTVTWGSRSVIWYSPDHASAQYNTKVTNYYLAIKL